MEFVAPSAGAGWASCSLSPVPPRSFVSPEWIARTVEWLREQRLAARSG